MHFCKECQNMYYIKLISNENDEETNIIKYHCRNCGYEDDTITTKNLCISSVDVKSKSGDCRYLINEYTKFDPTLPKTNKIKCPKHRLPIQVRPRRSRRSQVGPRRSQVGPRRSQVGPRRSQVGATNILSYMFVMTSNH